MKALAIILSAILFCGCGAQQRMDDMAAGVIVTGTSEIPGHHLRLLGMVVRDGSTIYDSCSLGPSILISDARGKFGQVDAIVGYHSFTGGCDTDTGYCTPACEGTAVAFDDPPAPRSIAARPQSAQ